MADGILSTERKGELFKLGDCLIMSWFPVLVSSIIIDFNPFFLAGSSMLLGGIISLIYILLQGKGDELFKIVRWQYFPHSIIFSCLGFSSLFWGLSYTTPINAAIIGKLEILFTFILWGVILKLEKYSKYAYLGSIFVIAGILIVLIPKLEQFFIGDYIIIGAAVFFPIGSFLSKKARSLVSSSTVFCGKYIISGIILLGIGSIFFAFPSATEWKEASLFIFFNGFFAFWLAKIFWVESIHRIPIVKALLIGGITPLLTMLWSYTFLDVAPNLYQIIAFMIVIFGVFLIIKKDFLIG